MDQEFASIDELPGYRFGNLGSIESRWVRGSKRHRLGDTWHVIKSRPNTRRQYLYVTLKTPLGRMHLRVNVLILWAFTGYRPLGMDASHKNGNRQDNRVDNLEWKSHAENIRDKHAHGTVRHGIDIPNARLNPESARQVKKLLTAGSLSMAEIGRIYGVSWATVRNIRDGKTWTRVEVA